jgi:hypothetical protein
LTPAAPAISVGELRAALSLVFPAGTCRVIYSTKITVYAEFQDADKLREILSGFNLPHRLVTTNSFALAFIERRHMISKG